MTRYTERKNKEMCVIGHMGMGNSVLQLAQVNVTEGFSTKDVKAYLE